jgi:uncharacterized protein
MSNPTPLQSFLGGMGLAIPVHFQLVLNGSVLGISGFLHNAVRGRKEALTSVAGFLMGGAIIGAVEGIGPDTGSAGLSHIAFSGLLVGIGTKVADFSFPLTTSHSRNFYHTVVRWLYFRVSTEHPHLTDPFRT